MSATSSSSSSWLVPFALGASTALSLVWLFRSLDDSVTTAGKTRGNDQSRSRKSKTAAASSAGNTSTSRPSPTTRTSKTKSSSSTRASENGSSNTINGSNSNGSGSGSDSNNGNGNELMDTADLDHRLLRKAEAVLQWRTTRLVVVVERCTNDHNYSAILRTAEALGIQKVYMIDPPEVLLDPDETNNIAANDAAAATAAAASNYADEIPSAGQLTQDQQRKLEFASPEEIQARRQHHLFARNATEWLTVYDFASSQDCVAQLRAEGYQLWVTDLSQQAQCLTMTSPQIPEKVALIMGTEAVGCSQYMLDEADLRVYLPLRGFADSLNLSVATALIVHQLLVMDPTLMGAISLEEKLELRQQWYTKLCQQRLLTPSQRKERRKLQNLLQKCQVLYDRSQQQQQQQQLGQGQGRRKLQPSEQSKLDQWDSYKERLAELDSLLDPQKVQAAIQDWVDHPPAPLTDVRRADEHRICYVGRNTKALHGEDWKDMVATSHPYTPHLSTAAAFREKVKQQQQQQ